MHLDKFFAAVSTLFVLLACGCHSGPRGTYSDTNKTITIEFKSGGKASMMFLGKTADCTYTSGSKQVTVKCRTDAEPIVLTTEDDGSLIGPPGGFMPTLHKTK